MSNKEKRKVKIVKEVFVKNVLKFFKISIYSNLNKSSTFA